MLNILKTKEIKQKITDAPEKVQEIIEAEKEIGICITNNKGIYVAVNDRYNEIYGYETGELKGQHFTVVVPEAKQDHLNFLHDKFIENEYEILRNWEVKRKDGKLIKIQADAGFFNTIFDQTPHKLTFVKEM